MTAPSSVMSRAVPKASPRVRNLIIAIVATLGAFVLLIIVTTQLPPSPRETANSTENVHRDGAKAVAQVLRANGVAVTEATELDATISAARANTTLAIILSDPLSQAAIDRINAVPADVVVIATMSASFSSTTVSSLTEAEVMVTWASPGTAAQANCADPDARAAEIAVRGSLELVVSKGATGCFGSLGSLYADLRTDVHRVTVLAGDQFIRNDSVTREGHAALALRVLGRHSALTWYLPGEDAFPSADDPDLDTGSVIWKMFPGWAGPVLAILLAAGAAAAFWRGRRFGKLVPEALPVAVPASEAAAGLGRLYRQSHACGHAGAALRAATAARLASRFGLSASSQPDVVVSRLSDALHVPPDLVHRLVYGPPPATDADLLVLAVNLRRLEDGTILATNTVMLHEVAASTPASMGVSPTSTVGGS